MKKPNAQAEPPSSPGELLRGSPAFCYFFYFLIDYKHKHTAVASELYVVHLLNSIFFYLFIDYKHKHTASGLELYVVHVRFFLFF